ncbi:MAG TPA: ATP-binding protein [Verrucomicrobiae bacterium]|nr:ATP-binding protein [Verrucomicrobiae bacterium]
MGTVDVQHTEELTVGLESDDALAPATPPDSIAPLFTNPADWFVPPFPEKLEDLDVNPGFLADLALKTVPLDVDCTTFSIATRMRLGMMITEALLQRLCQEKFIEAKGVVGLHNHRYAMLDHGWEALRRLTNFCSYAGPAPVSLKAYTEMITQQVRNRPPSSRQSLDQAMSTLILSDYAKEILGLVIGSGRSLFLTGPSGNGKTATARALVDAIPGEVWIPYAIEVDGQVIRIFDTHNHVPVKHPNDGYDRRWIRISPPLVVAGGELTLQSLDLSFTETQRFYEAPLHIKSNGGVLVVDDLGRQRCSATELLNRWIVPLEYRIDYLTLSTGKKIQVPFEQIVVFATNLTESDLEDEAFMRRMGYRLHAEAPSPETFTEIFLRYARARGLAPDVSMVAHLLQKYQEEGRIAKSCDPRDLIDRVIDRCRLHKTPPKLTLEGLDVVWNGYFGKRTTDPKQPTKARA